MIKYDLNTPPISNMETEARKMETPYLNAIASRCTRLIIEAFNAGDQEEVLRRQQERKLVCQIAQAKEELQGALT